MSSRIKFILLFGLLTVAARAIADAPIPPAVAADSRSNNSPYGILAFLDWDHDYNGYFSHGKKLDKSMDQLQKLGVRWVRMTFQWADIEPEKGRFDFSKYDNIVDGLESRGIKTLATLAYNPSWTAGQWNNAPVPEDFVAYARATVGHFKNRVQYWEVWNEPDQRAYWNPQDDLVAYSQMLQKVSIAIKQEDPTAKVVLGALVDEAPFRLRRIYRRVGKDAFDVVNLHPFQQPLDGEALSRLRGVVIATQRVMGEFADDAKPTWLTELGCPGVASEKNKSWWLGQAPTEEQQAQWLIKIYTEVLKWKGVDKVFWAFYRDTDNFFQSAVDDFGLVHSDFSEKPAYKAYQDLTHRSNAPDHS